jgi:SAM-dependent MidA family methyltransferase
MIHSCDADKERRKMKNDILQEQIQQAILQQGGMMSFADFMQRALYTPGYGYYTGKEIPFGEEGDFVTAPLVSPLFSQCIAHQIAEILPHCTQPILLECGAGSGEMAAQILMSLEALKQLPAAYWILELSAVLKMKQRETIEARCSHLLSRVVWLDALPTEPFEGVIIGNEVVDALPVTLFEWRDQQARERCVGLSSDHQFVWKNKIADPFLTQAVEKLHQQYGPWPDGFSSEIGMMQKPWLTALSHVFKRGLMLWIDYGERGKERYSPSRMEGSLRCYKHHQLISSPFEDIGQQDMTCDVDFTALALTGIEVGLTCAGYISQALFLMNCNVIEYAQQRIQQSPEHILKIQGGLRQLTHPAAMGEKFKVLALTKDLDESLCGFRMNDQKMYL